MLLHVVVFALMLILASEGHVPVQNCFELWVKSQDLHVRDMVRFYMLGCVRWSAHHF